jgi:hypothetical protein
MPLPPGYAVALPRRDGVDERVLHRVLRELEVTNMADEGRQYRGAVFAESGADSGPRAPSGQRAATAQLCSGPWPGRGTWVWSATGRTSTDP